MGKRCKRPMFLIGLFCVLIAFARLSVMEKQAAAGAFPDGPLQIEGTVTGVEDRGENTRLTLQTDGGGSHFLYVREEDAGLDAEGGFAVGNRVSAKGEYRAFRPPGNPGQFDMRRYYFVRDIRGQLFCDSVSVTGGTIRPIAEGMRRLRLRAASLLEELYGEEIGGIAKAMLLGERSSISDETGDLFRTGGISHILAISGLHITFFGQFLRKIMRRAGMPAFFACPLSVSILFLYVLFCGAGASAVRAFLFFALAQTAELAAYSYDLPSAWAFAAAVCLTWNPRFLYDGGFLLSFAASSSFALESVLFPSHAGGGRGPEPERAVFLKGDLRLIVLLEKGIEAGRSVLLLQLVLLPLICRFYFAYPLYSMILNLLVVPLMPFVMAFMALSLAPAALSSLFGAACPVGGIAEGTAASVFMGRRTAAAVFMSLGTAATFPARMLLRGFLAACRAVQHLPFSQIVTGQPALWRVFLYYLILLTALFAAQKKEGGTKPGRFGKKCERLLDCVRRSAMPGCVICALLLILLFRIPSKALSVTVTDTGQGDCIFVSVPGAGAVLVDGGSSDVTQPGKYRLIPFLKAKGVTRLRYVFLTHEDEDHINAVRELLEAAGKEPIRIEKLVLSDVTVRGEKGKELMALAEEAGAECLMMEQGDQIMVGDASFNCLHPTAGTPSSADPNQASLVLSLTYGNFSMLLTGDLEGEGEMEVAGRLAGDSVEVRRLAGDGAKAVGSAGEGTCSFTVLKVGHHGSGNGTSSELLDAASPRAAVISCGYRNRYGHPEASVLERLAERGIPVFRTDTDGAITIETDGKRFWIETFRR